MARRKPAPFRAQPESLADEEEGVEGADTTRLCAFSDGVFSIAITLLVLEVKVPEPETIAVASLAGIFTALAKQWPMYLAFVLGFLTIGIMWANHVTLFRYIARTDHKLVALNTLLLLVISMVPFATGMLARYLVHELPFQKAAMLVYAGNSVLMAVFFNLLWRYARRSPRKLMNEKVDPRLFDEVTRRYRFGPLIYLITFAVAFVSVPLCLLCISGLAVFFALPYEPGAFPFQRGIRSR